MSTTDDLILVDDCDFEKCSQLSWSFTNEKKESVRTNIRINGFAKRVSIANFILNDFRSIFDHKDRNPLNNQRTNLRIATPQQNSFNRGKAHIFDLTSKFKGVSFDKINQKWRAKISINRKQYSLGRFKTELEAAIAYNNEAFKLFGEFAVLNQI